MTPIIMVVLDGASDRPDGKQTTPLEAAATPNLDALARGGALGSMFTVGKGIAPESDAAVFSLLGYDPLQIHLSRGVVEAIGASVDFHDGDLALRAGFATVDGDKLVDRRAGRNLSTEEARQLAAAVNSEVRLKNGTRFQFHATVGHRAVVVFRADSNRFSSEISNFDPAYVRSGKISIAQPGAEEYDIPKCDPLIDTPDAVKSAALVNEFGFKTRQVLDSHPVNLQRRARGRKPANFILMRDAGATKPTVEGFRDKWGFKAAMIADLPAELGIGRLLGMDVREVPPGTSFEDYRKRAELVLRLAGEYDFVYVHLKGPDEPGHDGLYDLKRQRVEEIDSGFFSYLRQAAKLQRTVLCVTCDHSTPWRDKGHSNDPVPVLVAGGSVKPDGSNRFTETAASAGHFEKLERGSMLLSRLKPIAA
ncbi:MAG TPA: alkaline phosphatase family protein [Candidatus Angelobacter sp.]|nr:alkaline phosphatase family protein [Candidatus Angelobacter sp.]